MNLLKYMNEYKYIRKYKIQCLTERSSLFQFTQQLRYRHTAHADSEDRGELQSYNLLCSDGLYSCDISIP